MKTSTKACLLSALVFPGAGQILLRRRARGWAFIFSVLFLMVALIVRMTLVAYTALISNYDVTAPMDIGAIDQAVQASLDVLTQFGFMLIVVLWIWSIVDAYLLGKESGS